MPDNMDRRSPPRVHDLIAATYDAARPIPPLLQAAISSQVCELLPEGASRLLDVGAGTGAVRWRDGHGAGTIRLDHSSAMLAQVRNPSGRVCGDAALLPFRDAAFDAVVSRHVLEGLPERAPVISEIRRVLRHGAPYLHAVTRPPAYLREIHTWWRQQTNLLRIVNGRSHGYEASASSVDLDLVLSGASITRATTLTIPVSQPLDQVLAGYAAKAYPSCWELEDDAHRACFEELKDWAQPRFPKSLTGHFQTTMTAARW